MVRDRSTERTLPRLGRILCGLGVVGLVVVLYAPVCGHEFVDYDDGWYVYENGYVRDGLSWRGLVWALTTSHTSNWHPLTWLSHMLDGELFGLDPAGHHATSVLLHALNAVLLLSALRALTGRFWSSLLVTLLFAVHPLRVESVAWVSERKDVLSGLFWILALLAYARYAKAPGLGRYCVVVLCFVGGLMAKPMVVTLPLVLLLLDVWPLHRMRGRGRGHGDSPLRLLVEKLPLLGLSAASIVVTLHCSRSAGAMGAGEAWPLGLRLGNALVTYAVYLWKTVWPANLACFYPHPAHTGGLSTAGVIGSVVLLAALTTGAALAFGRRPWIAVGWLWFLTALIPTLGLVQVGYQGRADRYTYLPSIGLFVVLAWVLSEWVARNRGRRAIAIGAIAVVLIGAMALTRRQVESWRDTRTLFEHALRVTENNYVAHYGLGVLYDERGDARRAEEELGRALRIWPEFAPAHNRLGRVLQKMGRLGEARDHLERAVRQSPEYAEAHSNLGSVLEMQGKLEAALEHLRKAVQLRPDFARAHNNLGIVYARQGDLDRARTHYERSLELAPDLAEAWSNLANVYERQRRHRDAVVRYRRAVALDPGLIQAAEGLAWLLATSADPGVRDGSEALRWADHCVSATAGRHPGCLEALAAAHAESGAFEQAEEWQSRAVALLPAERVAEALRRLELYRAGRPCRVPFAP